MSKIIEYKDDCIGEKYYKIDHESGISVFVFPKDRQSSCAILSTEFGSLDNVMLEKNGKMLRLPDGIAHFMEHKMFDNENGENVDDVFSRLGADPNAYTSWDHTAYFFTCTSGEAFYECIENLVNFVTKPYFTEQSVAKERGIIEQEIAMCEDDPYDRCFYGMVQGLYKKHPVRIEVVGSQDSISQITPELLYKCHEQFYSPSNMTLVICGEADIYRVVEIIDKGFLIEVNPRDIKSIYTKEPHGVHQKLIEREMAVDRPIFSIGFKDLAVSEDTLKRRRRQLVADILLGIVFASSNELYVSLFEEGIMTTPFNYGADYGKSYAFCYANGECDCPYLLFEKIKKYISSLKRKGIDRDDFERRKKILYASDIKMYDSTWDIANAILDSASYEIDIFSELKMIESITLEETKELLNELFVTKRMTYSIINPILRKEKENGNNN